MHFRNAKDMKYYLYMSDAKLAMLHDQIEQRTNTSLSASIKAPFVEIGGKFETQKNATKEAMLSSVLKHIVDSGKMGTIDAPNEYVAGTISMRWGMFTDGGRPEEEPPLVYFGGKTDKTVFGLGGSTRHVIGFHGATSTGARSSTPYLVGRLLEGLGIKEQGWSAFGSWSGSGLVYQGIAIATHSLRPPEQVLEFAARTLLVGSVRHAIYTNDERLQCLLGTPLYVALAPPYPSDLLF